MEKRDVTHALREMLREQVCCIGRVAARHHLPDDAVWDVAKGFDVIYQRACQQAKMSAEGAEGGLSVRRAEPHPGLTFLLNRLDREDADTETGDSLLAGTGAKQSHA
jgi:hypothetical protein